MKLEIAGLTKRYSKEKYGLKDFTLTIEKGILGLLGANGAGKSTLLKMIATVSKPSAGHILLNDEDTTKSPNAMRLQLGYLPQDFGVYPNLNAFEFLQYMASMKGVGGKGLKDKIHFLLEGLNLMEVASRPIGNYSGGMKQRIGIAQALLNDPKVILFDEPTVGLDPEERVRFRDLISELAHESIIILSSHIVSDIDTIADKVAIMKQGTLITTGTPEEIISTVKNQVFEKIVNRDELDQYKREFIVISTARSGEQVKVRFISNTYEGESVLPTLEDGYLYLSKQA